MPLGKPNTEEKFEQVKYKSKMNRIKDALKFIGFFMLIVIITSGIFQFSKSIKHKSKEKKELIELEKERLRLEIQLKKKQLNLNSAQWQCVLIYDRSLSLIKLRLFAIAS